MDSKTIIEEISYKDAARELDVSNASVRNWVKCGYLHGERAGHINLDSFLGFKLNVAGKSKLMSRANKSLLDDHNHKELTHHILSEIPSIVSGEQQSINYETRLSNSYKNKEGIYYTPLSIAADFFINLPFSPQDKSFCDPCCGTGNYILSALNAGYQPESIWGFDTDPVAVEITRKRVFEATGRQANIYVADFFAIINAPGIPVFDLILTNPPWGKKICKSERDRMAGRLNAGRSHDTCSLFLLAALSVVNQGGVVGMLLPEAFFNVGAFAQVRRQVLSHRILSVKDYGKPFKGVLSNASSLILQKSPKDVDSLVSCHTAYSGHTRTKRSFQSNPNSIINFTVSSQEDRLIKDILGRPYQTLAGKAQWGLGIVTGNNRRFIKDQLQAGYVPVYRGSDIKAGKILAPGSFIASDMSEYQQVAPIKLYKAESKIIYKFISSKLVFFHDTEQRYILNSANLLIPSDQMQVDHSVLAAYLSCGFVNWFYRNIFASYKVLKSNLERIPVFTDFLNRQESFEEAKLLEYLGLEEQKNGAYRVKASS